MNKTQKLEKELEKVREEYKNYFDENFGKTSDFEEFGSMIEPFENKIREIELEIRLIEIPKYNQISQFGNHIHIDEFIKLSKEKSITDYDGYGKYATSSNMSNILIYPSDVFKNKIRKDFSYVVWFNK